MKRHVEKCDDQLGTQKQIQYLIMKNGIYVRVPIIPHKDVKGNYKNEDDSWTYNDCVQVMKIKFLTSKNKNLPKNFKI